MVLGRTLSALGVFICSTWMMPTVIADDAPAEVAPIVEQHVLPAAREEGNSGLALRDRMDWYRVPGVSVALVKNNQIVFARGYGDGIDENTLFQAASISKPVTAVAAMRLVEEGKLALDRDISDYLTSWQLPAGAQSTENPVTARAILSHTAGFTVHGFRGYAPGETVPSLVHILNGEAPANSAPIYVDQAPGTDWRYSGGGTTVLQLMMEDISGLPFETLMAQKVLTPAGMRASSFAQPLPVTKQENAAKAYDHKGVERAVHTYPEQAAAGLWTTPRDLMTLIVSLNKNQGPIRKDSFDQMAQLVTEGMGIGFAVNNEGENLWLSHGGSNAGFRCLLIFFPARGEGAVVMTNAAGGGLLQMEIMRAVAASFGWPDFAAKQVPAAHMDTGSLDQYTGRYLVDEQGFTIDVSRSGKGLVLTTGRGSRYFAIPAGDRSFIIREDGSELKIEPQTAGGFTLKLWGMSAKPA